MLYDLDGDVYYISGGGMVQFILVYYFDFVFIIRIKSNKISTGITKCSPKCSEPKRESR